MPILALNPWFCVCCLQVTDMAVVAETINGILIDQENLGFAGEEAGAGAGAAPAKQLGASGQA